MNAQTREDHIAAQSLYSMASIQAAMLELRQLGRSGFLAKHGLTGGSQRWFIDDGSDYYDAEAVAAASLRAHDPNAPITSQKIEAGAALPVALRAIGLTVVENPYRCLVLASNESHARPEFEKWKDVTGERYHFPNQYRNRIRPGREFIYYKGARRKDGTRAIPEYFGWGRIGEVYPDVTTTHLPKAQWHWLCDIEDYHELEHPVPFKDERGHYIELNTTTPPQRYWENGVRAISERTFQRILAAAGVAIKPKPTLPLAQAVLELSQMSDPLALLVKPSAGATTGKSGGGRAGRRSARAKEIGDAGERLFLESLRKQASSLSEREQIVWVANLGETPGWDIEDRRQKEIVAYEVKATNGSMFPAIEITVNEWSAAERLRERYNLVLIIDCESASPKMQIINDPWGLVQAQQLCAEPIMFRLARL